MKPELGDEARLKHILDAIREVQLYVMETDLEEFSRNLMKRHATIKQLEIIGEAANHISEVTKVKYPEIKWKEIIGLGNILIHEYFGVDERVVWGIINEDIPELQIQISQILVSM
jgi:uncharacterized protein with HEPN domain